MRFGVYVPNFGDYADPRRLVELARDAERAGWHGFFLYDHILADARSALPADSVVDPWIALAAIAATTERIRFGPLVTPAARRRPWKLAREVAALDHLSRGRVVLGVGLGSRGGFAAFGEDPDDRVRADKLDETLAIVTALWTGEPVRFEGKHFRVDGVRFLPPPVQRPRPPIWVAGIWPHRPPFRRAARFDGVFPLCLTSRTPTPAEIREIAVYVAEHRAASVPFDLVVGGESERDAAAHVADCARAGATWWLEWLSRGRGGFEAMQARVRAGPPVEEVR